MHEPSKRNIASNSTQQASEKDSKGIDRFFIEMVKIYSNAWVKIYGNIDKDNIWAGALKGLTKDEIKQGLDAIQTGDKYKVFPPQPLEFRALCRPKENEDYDLKTAYQDFMAERVDKIVKTYQNKIYQNLKFAILFAKTDKEVAASYIEEIYSELKGILN